MTAVDGFWGQWQCAAAIRTNLAFGVAPSPKWLAAWGLPDSIHGAEKFCAGIAEVVGELSAVKIQTPFLERFGADGLRLARRLADRCRAAGTLVIADAKRNDAEDTAQAYADCYLGPDSIMGCDALTLLPFMGIPSVLAVAGLAEERGCGVMVLVRTSNHAAGPQTALIADGDTVAMSLARAVAGRNADRRSVTGGPLGPVAALAGAPAEEARALLQAMPGTLVSLPGLGRPGRTFEEFAKVVGQEAYRVLLPITTGLLSVGPHGVADKITQYQASLREHRLTVT